MIKTQILLSFTLSVLAARPFMNQADTGFGPFIPDNNELPSLDNIFSLPDFDEAAQNFMTIRNYSYYRTGAGAEVSYQDNLEGFGRLKLRPRILRDITQVNNSMPTKILGYNYSAPFFIAPAGRAQYAHPEGERSIMRAAEAANVLYVPSFRSSIPLEEIVMEKTSSEFVTFQQLYVEGNDTIVQQAIRRIEAAGQKAIVLTVDSAGDGVRPRSQRYSEGSADVGLTYFTWERYARIRNMTNLPVIPKGIATVEDAQMAIQVNAPAIYISNHGGRQLDTARSSLAVVLEIFEKAPEVFQQIDVWADGGVRYGTDVLKLLALGVKAVGLARPFMYANCYGDAGISHAIDLLRNEIINDAANLGVADLKQINSSSLDIQHTGCN